MLVHGLVVSSRYMVRLARLLGATFAVYAPDLPGYGRSRHSDAPARVGDLADELARFLRSLDLPPAVVVGNSFGCQIGASLAVRYPERVDRLVLQGPTVPPSERSIAAQVRGFLSNALREPPTLGPILLRDYANAGFRRARRTLRAAIDDRIEDSLGRIQHPALVVAGLHDVLAPVGWSERVARSMPRGCLAVVDGAHTLVYTHADEMERVIREFVQEGDLETASSTLGRRPRTMLSAQRPRPPKALAEFDSASAMVRAASLSLRASPYRDLGIDSAISTVMPLGNALPKRIRAALYRWFGWATATAPAELGAISTDELCRWASRSYPPRRYPAIFLGSSNGAITHLAAAMDAPFLPQTFLLPVRTRSGGLMDLQARMEWAREPARRLLDANPELQLHHMHDPNQDALMAHRMAYFRVKLRTLPRDYVRFIEEQLEPGGTIYLVDCRQRWPVTQVDDRHVFQPGAVGGLAPEDYLSPDPRLDKFVAEVSGGGRWRVPRIDASAPEAEWGFEPTLAGDVRDLARARGLRVQRISFDAPEDLSPVVADLFRSWYADAGESSERVLVSSFLLMEPYWSIRTRTVPLWTTFAVESSARAAEAYLAAREPFPSAYAFLFPHGVSSVGHAGPSRWRRALASASNVQLLGVDERAYPADFAALVRYHRDLRRQAWPDRGPMPPLTTEQLDHALERHGNRNDDAHVAERLKIVGGSEARPR